jgi:hypothetical protein
VVDRAACAVAIIPPATSHSITTTPATNALVHGSGLTVTPPLNS